MVAYSFQARFVPLITSGAKMQTIRTERAGRSRHAQPGQTVQLYTAMRRSECQLLGTGTCAASHPVRLVFGACPLLSFPARDHHMLDSKELDIFARLDGFEDWSGLTAWFRENHSDVQEFTGVLIRWTDFIPAGLDAV